MAIPSSTLQFRTFSDTSSLHAGPIRPIDEYETNLWNLASILFDEIPLNATNERIHRKRELSTFFKDLVSHLSGTISKELVIQQNVYSST